MRENLRFIFLLAIGLAAASAVGWFVERCKARQTPPPGPAMDTLVIRDTLRVTIPTYVAETLLHVVRVPVAVPRPVTPADTLSLPDTLRPDTVWAELPITQRRYADSTYTAWVSGYAPRLDSIHLRPVHTVVTIRREAKKPRRWQFGLQGGVGMTPEGVQPYIGIGVSYNILAF